MRLVVFVAAAGGVGRHGRKPVLFGLAGGGGSAKVLRVLWWTVRYGSILLMKEGLQQPG
jgi:hypothetical protein